jgi:hypothetical protein
MPTVFSSSESIKVTDKNHHFESLLPFPEWGEENVSPFFSPLPPTLSCYILKNGQKRQAMVAKHIKQHILKIIKVSLVQWLTPVILTTQKAEIRRIEVQSQPQANS